MDHQLLRHTFTVESPNMEQKTNRQSYITAYMFAMIYAIHVINDISDRKGSGNGLIFDAIFFLLFLLLATVSAIVQNRLNKKTLAKLPVISYAFHEDYFVARVEEVNSYHEYRDITKIKKNFDGYYIYTKQGQHYSIGRSYMSEKAKKFLDELKEKVRREA